LSGVGSDVATAGGVIEDDAGSGVTISVNASGRPHDASAIDSDVVKSAEVRISTDQESNTVNGRVSRMLGKGGWPVALLFFSLFGVFMISTRVVQPNIPQGSAVFPAPYDAIKVLASKLPEGRVFNSSQFGDMMIWHLVSQEKPILGKDPFDCPPTTTKPKVFIDTRFDMYGAPLVSDYYVMKNAKPGWSELFERYQFDWVFMPQKEAIVKALHKDPRWTATYNEKDAVIFVRNSAKPSP